MKKIFLLLIVLLGAVIVNAQEFSIKNCKDNTIAGPFEFKEGGTLPLLDGTYIIRDSDKFGKGSFTLEFEKDSKKYGPFNLRNNNSFTIGQVSYSIFVVEDPEQRAKQNAAVSVPPENKGQGKLNSDLLIKFEKTLDVVERNFGTALNASPESQWMTEYQAKVTELKLIDSELQNEVMRVGLDKDFNIPKYVLTISSALNECRQGGGKSGSGYCFNDNRSSSGKRNSSDDALTSAGKSMYSGNGSRKSALKTDNQDFALAVTHLRENIRDLAKTGYWNSLRQDENNAAVNRTRR